MSALINALRRYVGLAPLPKPRRYTDVQIDIYERGVILKRELTANRLALGRRYACHPHHKVDRVIDVEFSPPTVYP